MPAQPEVTPPEVTHAQVRLGPVRLGSGRRWADLRLRVLSAGLLAPIGLTCLWVGGIAWTVLIVTTSAGLAIEWATLCARLARSRRWAVLVGGILYVAATTVSLLWLRADPVAGRPAVLFLVLVVWASDIGAYAAGRALGGPRLAPAISPSKTWAGALGGLAAASLAGLLMGEIEGRTLMAPLAAAALGIAAQAGDLLESAVKRGFGVKDSGSVIPGHGGLFDRLDGLLSAGPVAAGLAILAGRGVVFWQ